jgi:hypothetical protein
VRSLWLHSDRPFERVGIQQSELRRIHNFVHSLQLLKKWDSHTQNFELTGVTVEVVFLWVLTPCSLVGGYRHFGGTVWLRPPNRTWGPFSVPIAGSLPVRDTTHRPLLSWLLMCGGELSMCYTPPTLITVYFDLVQHFIEDTVLQLVTGNWVSNKLVGWVEFILRPTVSRPVRPAIGLPFGAHDQILSFPFYSDICFNVLPVGRPLWREDGSVV